MPDLPPSYLKSEVRRIFDGHCLSLAFVGAEKNLSGLGGGAKRGVRGNGVQQQKALISVAGISTIGGLVFLISLREMSNSGLVMLLNERWRCSLCSRVAIR